MTGIAIGNQRATGALGRTAAGLLLVAAGVAAGIGIADLGLVGGNAAKATTLGAAEIAADGSWQAFRAGERQANVPLSGNSGYQAFRTGEQLAGETVLDAGYVEFREGERQPAP